MFQHRNDSIVPRRHRPEKHPEREAPPNRHLRPAVIVNNSQDILVSDLYA
jgi:hypothetical protein